jgi:acylphosphatase
MSLEWQVVRVRIGGLVQGVGFRAWTQEQALALGLAGFVRNRRDGNVEAVFAGTPEAIAAISAACWHGPPSAHVTRVDVEEADRSALAEMGGAEGFRQLPTL